MHCKCVLRELYYFVKSALEVTQYSAKRQERTTRGNSDLRELRVHCMSANSCTICIQETPHPTVRVATVAPSCVRHAVTVTVTLTLTLTVTVTCMKVEESAWFIYPILRWSRCPEIGTSSIDWAQWSRFHLKTERESSLRNVVF
jgi:hypothetical protein